MERLQQLKRLFPTNTRMYIDFANTRMACERMGWRIDVQKLKSLTESIGSISSVRFYFGTITGDFGSEGFMARVRKVGFQVRTKPVKFIRRSIDMSSVSKDSTDILKEFVDRNLLRHLRLDAVEYLNRQLYALNRQGILFLETRKCNFDVEIGTDMLLDRALQKAEIFCLWSGDSDFADPISQLLRDGKKVVVVARKVATELNSLRTQGLIIYDLRKLRGMISLEKQRGLP